MHPSPIRLRDIEALALHASDYPPEVMQRISWFLHYMRGGSVSATCRHFGIARTTFYRWWYRLDLSDLRTLIDDVPSPPDAQIPRNQEYPLPEFAPALPSHGVPMAAPKACCRFCKIFNALAIKRSLIVASVLLNLAIFASALTVLVAEGRRNMQADTTDVSAHPMPHTDAQ